MHFCAILLRRKQHLINSTAREIQHRCFLSNIQPISLVNNINEVFKNYTLLQRLRSFNENHKILNDHQFRFRSKLDTNFQ